MVSRHFRDNWRVLFLVPLHAAEGCDCGSRLLPMGMEMRGLE